MWEKDPVPWLQDVFVTPRHLAIVMEHCNGGDLASLISKRLRHGVRSSETRSAQLLLQHQEIPPGVSTLLPWRHWCKSDRCIGRCIHLLTPGD
jgi:serine/threonine protein kinase